MREKRSCLVKFHFNEDGNQIRCRSSHKWYTCSKLNQIYSWGNLIVHVQVPFQQVDVFTGIPFKGNPVAVVFDGNDLLSE